jgi:hypothetical protein
VRSVGKDERTSCVEERFVGNLVVVEPEVACREIVLDMTATSPPTRRTEDRGVQLGERRRSDARAVDGQGEARRLRLLAGRCEEHDEQRSDRPAQEASSATVTGACVDHLLTHGVIVGMTGSGKTGLVTVLVEEALRAQVPVLVIDIKGDLPNLALAFPSFDTATMTPWVEPAPGDADGIADPPVVASAIAARRAGLSKHGIGEPELADFGARLLVRVITPGSDAGERLHLLSSLERRSPRWDHDVPGARAGLSAAISLVLRLIGRESDPGRSKEHALLAVLAERRLAKGLDAPLDSLVAR